MSRGRTPAYDVDGDTSVAEGLMSSIYDMPNTPGIRPNHLSLLNKSAAARKVIAERAMGASRPGTGLSQMSRGLGGLGGSRPSTALSYYEDPEFFNSLAESLNPYPSTAHVPNDLSGRYSLHSQREDRRRNTRALPFASYDEVPSFVVSGETVCRFFAYCIQILADNNKEPERLRKVEILMYQSDMTLEIKEVKVSSGGLVPISLKRHQVMKPDEEYENQPYYTIYDCNAGSVLNIYNSYYTLVDADKFTRNYMRERGMDFGEAIPFPSIGYNPSASWVSVVDTINEARMQAQRESQEKAMKFFEYNTQVLRYFGVWTDRVGNSNAVKIHYYLADDTIEVISLYGKNDGRDHVPKFLKRMKIRKPANDDSDVKPGGSLLMSSTFEDPLDITIPPYYSWVDFVIGGIIRFAGIKIFLTDADDFTRQFYRNNGTPLGEPVRQEEAPKRKYSIRIPPHNGIGSEEDSLQTCKGSLLPKAPKRDGAKAAMFAGQVLRYKCKFANPSSSDSEREFVIQAFLEDDTIQIQELAVRNSGFSAGKFLARGKQVAPDGSRLLPQDLFIGGVVQVRCHAFEIVDADERTIKHMESNCLKWPQSNLNSIKHRLQIAGDAIQEQIAAWGDAAVGYEAVRSVLQAAGVPLTKQESITLFRDMDPKNSGLIRTSALLV